MSPISDRKLSGKLINKTDTELNQPVSKQHKHTLTPTFALNETPLALDEFVSGITKFRSHNFAPAD